MGLPLLSGFVILRYGYFFRSCSCSLTCLCACSFFFFIMSYKHSQEASNAKKKKRKYCTPTTKLKQPKLFSDDIKGKKTKQCRFAILLLQNPKCCTMMECCLCGDDYLRDHVSITESLRLFIKRKETNFHNYLQTHTKVNS